jgi:hypothetical protein
MKVELLTMDFAFQNRSRRPRPGGGLLVCSWSTMLLSAAMRSCCNILQIGDAMFSILVLQLLVNQLCNKYLGGSSGSAEVVLLHDQFLLRKSYSEIRPEEYAGFFLLFWVRIW